MPSADNAVMGARTGGFLVRLWGSGIFLGKLAIGLVGVLAFYAADTYFGGRVLESMWGWLGWAVSVALSAATLALVGFAVAKKGLTLMLLFPAVIVGSVDIAVDSRFPTLGLYGADALMTSWITPHFSPGWWMQEVVVVTVTLLSEWCILLIFAWLLMELKKVGQEVSLPHLELPATA